MQIISLPSYCSYSFQHTIIALCQNYSCSSFKVLFFTTAAAVKVRGLVRYLPRRQYHDRPQYLSYFVSLFVAIFSGSPPESHTMHSTYIRTDCCWLTIKLMMVVVVVDVDVDDLGDKFIDNN